MYQEPLQSYCDMHFLTLVIDSQLLSQFNTNLHILKMGRLRRG